MYSLNPVWTGTVFIVSFEIIEIMSNQEYEAIHEPREYRELLSSIVIIIIIIIFIIITNIHFNLG